MKTEPCSSSDELLLKRLVAAGRPMPLEIEQEPQRDLAIELSRPEVTVAYDMRAGTEFVFAVHIKNESYSVLSTRIPMRSALARRGDVPWRSEDLYA